MYIFGIQFSLLFHVWTDTQSLLLNTDQTIANELVFTQNFHHHIVPLCFYLCVCLLICYSIYQLWWILQYFIFLFYYVRPDCLLVLYQRKKEMILSLIHFINTTFSTRFTVARIYIVPKMRLNNEKCHFILLPELCNLKNEMRYTTYCDTWMETSCKPTRG